MVSQKVGGVPDIVRPRITGLLSNPEDVEGFRGHIIELLDNKALRSEMRRHCRRIAVEEYSIGLQAQRYIHLYRELLNGTKESEGVSRES